MDSYWKQANYLKLLILIKQESNSKLLAQKKISNESTRTCLILIGRVLLLLSGQNLRSKTLKDLLKGQRKAATAGKKIYLIVISTVHSLRLMMYHLQSNHKTSTPVTKGTSHTTTNNLYHNNIPFHFKDQCWHRELKHQKGHSYAYSKAF